MLWVRVGGASCALANLLCHSHGAAPYCRTTRPLQPWLLDWHGLDQHPPHSAHCPAIHGSTWTKGGGTQWQPATAVGSRARHGVARDLWLVTLSFGAERKRVFCLPVKLGWGHRGPQVRKPCVVAGLPAHLWRRPPFPPTRVQQVLIKHLPGLLALGIHPDACCGVGLVGTALGTRGRHLLRARYGSQSQQEAKTPRAARG